MPPMLAPLLSSLLLAAPAPSPALVESLPEAGMGLGGVAYYSPAWPFTDALRVDGRGWRVVGVKGKAARVSVGRLDGQGNVTDLAATGDRVEARPMQNIQHPVGYPAGRYVLEWSGDADLSLTTGFGPPAEPVESGPNRKVYDIADRGRTGLGVTIERSADAPDHASDVSLWMPDPRAPKERSLAPSDQEKLPEAERWTSELHPEYVEHLKSAGDAFGWLRAMDWTHTNNNPEVEWDDRRPPDATFWVGDTYNRDGFDFVIPGTEDQVGSPGVPWEAVIEVANRTGRDVWICVPHAATDDYVVQLARLFKEDLDPAVRRVYLEHSNEIWSGGGSFRQGQWAQQQAEDRGVSKGAFNGTRAAEVWDLFVEEFDPTGDRVVNVAAAFTAVPSYTREYLDAATANDGEKPEVLAVTTYFGQPLVEYAFNELPWRDADPADYADPDNPLVNAVLDHLLNDLVLAAGDEGGEQGSSAGGFGPKNVALAREYGLPLVSYEGNTSIYTEGRQWHMADKGEKGGEKLYSKKVPGAEFTFSVNNYVQETYDKDLLTSLMSAAQRHERFAEIYDAHLQIAKDLGLYTQGSFVDVGAWGKHGQWGHKEYLGQPVEEATKWTALLAWQEEMEAVREVGVGTEPVGTRPELPPIGTLGGVFAGGEYSADIKVSGGEGDRTLTVEAHLLPEGLTAEQVDDETLRVSGTVGEDAQPGRRRMLVRAVDADGDPDWAVYAVDVLDLDGHEQTFDPAADLTGDSGSDRGNATGTQDTLLAGTGGRRAYLRFDPTVIGSVESATLRLPVRGIEGNQGTGELWVEPVDGDFGESAPYGEVPDSGEAITGRKPAGGVVEFDVTDAVRNGTTAFAVRGEVTGGKNGFVAVILASRESGDGPTLVVEQRPKP